MHNMVSVAGVLFSFLRPFFGKEKHGGHYWVDVVAQMGLFEEQEVCYSASVGQGS